MRWLCTLLLGLSTPADADEGLVQLAQAAAEGGRVWLQQDSLVVGSVREGERRATRPLQDYAPMILPPDMSDFVLLGEGCEGPLRSEADEGGFEVRILATTPIPNAEGRLFRGRDTLARVTLPAGVVPCETLLLDLSPHPGLEAVVVWRLGRTAGVTVWSTPLGISPSPEGG